MSEQSIGAAGPGIELEDVSLTLGGTEILADVSLGITPGAIHCLVGPNGGGKTCLVRCILGQMPHAGKIEVAWQENETIGYVPQRLDFDSNLPITVLDLMTLSAQRRRPVFLGPKSEARSNIESTLALVGMEAKATRVLGALSGGERQRALFAQALLPSPGLLVLDEPLAGIDEEGAEMVTQRVRELAEQGVTVLWIEHDLPTVREVADEVSAIGGGVLFTGKTQDIAEQLTPDLLFGTGRTRR
ncbi:MAG: metal ABC transporter ATP-binding protein [Acidobacteriota bacterium]